MVEINLALAQNLISKQFPEYDHLKIKPVEVSGWDNRTFRLGDDKLIRLPSSQAYAPKVAIEQKWLPFLAKHLSVKIPKPIKQGTPSSLYPWSWSIYEWIDGQSVNTVELTDTQLNHLAKDLAAFLKELQAIDTTEAPTAGAHNFYRGAHPSVYADETKQAINALKDDINVNQATHLWETAMNSKWEYPPVWIHGDFSAGNMLVKDGKLEAIIDFGGMGIGEPSCDMVIAWTLLRDKSRQIFKSELGVDEDTWLRGKAWALWKALITVEKLDRQTADAKDQLVLISTLFKGV